MLACGHRHQVVLQAVLREAAAAPRADRRLMSWTVDGIN